MIDQVADLVEITSVKQMRVLADPLRQRIIQPLTRQRMTVTQVGELLGLSPAKVHYHVRELERVGLVRMVETREKGGILEKYYQAIGKNFTFSAQLMRAISSDEPVGAMSEFLSLVSREFLEAVAKQGKGAGMVPMTLGRTQFWATDDETRQLMRRVDELFEPYLDPRGIDKERERTFVELEYDTPVEESRGEDIGGKRRRVVAAGVYLFDHEELENAVSRGETLDITVVGVCTFADDVSAELAERAIGSFRHRGILRASPEVREVLRRKEGSTTEPFT